MEGLPWQLGIVPGVGDVSSSRGDMLRGTSIVMSVGSIQVGIMERIDTTDPDRKLRFIRTVNGIRVKSRFWFDKTGAREITSGNKTKIDQCSYDLRTWSRPGRFAGTRILRTGRKYD